MGSRFTNISGIFGKVVANPIAVSSPEGEGTPFQVDAKGRLWVHIAGDVRVTNVLSNSTDGRPITLPSGVTDIHTATAVAGETDQMWIWLSNTGSAAAIVTLNWGGVSVADQVPIPIAANDTIVATAGIPIKNGLTISAESDLPDVINVTGFVETVS